MTAVIFLLVSILDIAWWFVIIGVVMSWLVAFNVINLQNQFVYSVYSSLNSLIEPMLKPIRRFLPDMGGIDISPIVLLLAISFIRIWVVTSLAPLLGVA
ncbi:MAG: YggT family protein [bacterium]|nr:YggT family protein [bacterium]